MQKVKILVGCAGPGFSYVINEIVEMPKDRAKEFIKIGYAEEIPKEKSKKPTKKVDIDE